MSTSFQLKTAQTVGDTFTDANPTDLLMCLNNGTSNRAIVAGFTSTAVGAVSGASKMRMTSSALSVAGVLSAASLGIGTVTPQSALDVVGTISVSSNLNVVGSIAVGSNLTITGGLTVLGAITSAGQSVVGGSSSSSSGIGTTVGSNVTISGGLTVLGTLVAGELLLGSGSLGSSSSSSVPFSYPTIHVSSNITFGSNYVAFGSSSNGSNVVLTGGDLQLSSNLIVSGYQSNAGSVFGLGASNVGGVLYTAVHSNAGAMSVSGLTSLGGNVTVSGILNVTGQIMQGGSNLVAAAVASGGSSSTGLASSASNITCQMLTVTNTLTLGSNAISFTNGSGTAITAQTWNYMANYVYSGTTITPTVSRTLFMGVAQSHSAYVQNGNVYVFGLNSSGQLGLGDLVNRPLPTMIPGVTGAVAVACGQGFTVVLLTNGTALAMGNNANGMLGDGTITTRLVPTVVLGVTTATNVVAGFFHVLFLLASGAVVGYGSSSNGQLGAGTTAVVNTTLVTATLPTGTPAASFVCRAIDAGAYHSVMLLVNGTAYSFGQNTYAQLGQGNTTQLTVPTLINYANLVRVVNVGAGQFHTLLVLYDGTVLSCGRNDSGQCGAGNVTSPQTAWTTVITPPGSSNASAGLNTYVAAGTAHTVVQKADGTVWVFGSNALGQLGVGIAITSCTVPTQLIMQYAVYTAFAVAAGANHTVILLNNDVTVAQKNRIVAFGDNSSGQVGTALQGVVTAYTPFPISDGSMIYNKRLMIGSYQLSCGYVDVDGTGYMWGANNYNQIGDGTTTNRLVPVALSGFNFTKGSTRLVCLVGGNNGAAALDSNGMIYTWGFNGSGQLGNNTVINSSVPVQISSFGSLQGVVIVAISQGTAHCLALDSTGTLHAWGWNGTGQIGNNTTNNALIPIIISGFGTIQGKTIVAISASWKNSCALDSTGTLHSWGSPQFSGLGTNSNTLIPTNLCAYGSLSGAIVVSCCLGYLSGLAIDSLGALHAWGYNGYGQLGDGTSTDKNIPVNVSIVSANSIYGRFVVQAACGDANVSVVDSTGAVHSCGANNGGQIGNNTNNNIVAFVNVSSFGSISGKTVVALAAGAGHVLAMDSLGMLHTWGINDSGQNGNNSTNIQKVPALVSLNSRTLNIPMFSHGGLGDTKLLKGRNSDLGVLLAVGANTYGQIGDGTTTTRPNLTALATLSSTVISCASGVNHSGAITSNGSCYLWGRNNLGQCSTNNSNNVLVPTLTTPAITNAASVTCGTGCSFVTLVDGSVLCLGDNSSNQLGVSSNIATASNAMVVNGLTNVVQLSSGGGASLALTSGGSVYSWGNNALGATGQGTLVGTTSNAMLVNPAPWNSQAVTRITSGNGVSALVTANGACYTCGANTEGALGQSNSFGTGCVSTFAMVSDPNSSYLTGFGNAVVDARCGARHTVLLLANNTVRTFGTNAAGQLNGVIGPNQWQPVVPAPNVNNNAVVAIAASSHSSLKEYIDRTTTSTGVTAVASTLLMGGGGFCSFIILPNGIIYGWGYNNGGSNTFNPQSYAGFGSLVGTYFKSIFASINGSVVACDSEGCVHGFGNNTNGTLGNGTTSSSNQWPPVSVSYTAGSSIANVCIVQVTAGDMHIVALDSLGNVHTWGSNSNGQLGYGNTTSSYLPVQIMSIAGSSLQGQTIVAVSASSLYSLALDATGRIHSWGRNVNGVLGNGNTTDQPLPSIISTNSNGSLAGRKVTKISAGGNSVLAIDSLGNCHAWGGNSGGQLGTGDTSSRLYPVNISNNGTLAGKFIVGIGSSGVFATAIDSAGALYQWGANGTGQLGDGTGNSQLLPISPMVGALTGKRIISVSPGNDHTIALDSTGIITAWGANWGGMIGNNSTSTQNTPLQINGYGSLTTSLTVAMPIVPLSGASTVLMNNGGAGGPNSLIITPLGVCHCWGAFSTSLPASFATYGSYAGVFLTCISSSSSGVLACDSAGLVHVFGTYNGYGQLGNGTTTAQTPASVISSISGSSLNGVRVVSVQAGSLSSCALDSNGNIHTWGANDQGEVGDGTAVTRTLPVQIMTVSGSSLVGKKIAVVSAGWRHTLALDTNGLVHSFGTNLTGQLGNGAAGPAVNVLPTMISNVANSSLVGKVITTVVAGTSQSIALDTNGQIHIWGGNAAGQLGNNTTTDSPLPINISAFGSLSGKTFVAVAAGADFSMALDSSGKVHMWGGNAYGDLANNTTVQVNLPFISTFGVLPGKRIVAIAAGNNNCIACDSTGMIICWGQGGSGQIGMGQTGDIGNPVQISGVYGSLISPLTTAPVSISFTPFFVNFTGQHRVFVAGETVSTLGTKEGFIVVCDQEDYITASGSAPTGKFSRGKSAITVNDALPVVSIAKKAYDKRVLGVLSSTLFPLYPDMPLSEKQSQRLVEVGDIRMEVNAIGAGAIWVSDFTGPIGSGDLITSSTIPGYGMLQADSLSQVVQNFTVAKATCSCDFTAPLQPVWVVQVDADGLNLLDVSGAPLWVQSTCTVLVDAAGAVVSLQQQQQMTPDQIQALTSQTVPQTEPKYEMRWLKSDGTLITQALYDTMAADSPATVFRAALIGCTYHCG